MVLEFLGCTAWLSFTIIVDTKDNPTPPTSHFILVVVLIGRFCHGDSSR